MINRYLYYSYNPNCSQSNLSEPIREAVQPDLNLDKKSELVATGQQMLKKSIDREVNTAHVETEHVIPLSSGLDSRTILALLLDHPDVNPESITTVSFGTPGTWDFEIGQNIAKRAGVKNISFNLTASDFDWSLSSLREFIRGQACPVRVFEGYVNAKLLDEVDSDAVVWSGFMGDPTAGGHQPSEPTDSWRTACEYFAKQNQFVDGLASADFDPIAMLPDESYLDRSLLSYEEQLDFAHRQQCLIAPLVTSEPDRYRTPFLQPEWLSFSLNLSHEYRNNRSLFKDIVVEMYPELFSLPTDANRGLPLRTGKIRELIHRTRLFTKRNVMQSLEAEYIPPSTNYCDFGNLFREPGELRTAAKTLIKDFAERDVANWIEPRTIWNTHQSGEDRTSQIRAICTVELICSETDIMTGSKK
jgi:hypothetical protein